MTVQLIGGGWDGDGAAWQRFADEARSRAGGTPRIAVVAVREGDAEEHAARLLEPLGEVRPVVLPLAHGDHLDPALLDEDLDGLLIGGGLTPVYLDAVLPARDRIRALVAAGVPYAGFSAGSAIAADRALLGGWLRSGAPVVDEEVAEDLDEVTVRDGLGLVPFSVDVHAAQWGTLARLVAAVGDGLVPRGAAIDEHTALIVDGDRARVEGTGNVWWAEPAPDGALVRREPASAGPSAALFRRR